MNTPIRFVKDVWDDNCKAGDSAYYEGVIAGRVSGIMFRCPRCNGLGMLSLKPQMWDEHTGAPTYYEPFVHNAERCGWRGNLTNGVFVEIVQ